MDSSLYMLSIVFSPRNKWGFYGRYGTFITQKSKNKLYLEGIWMKSIIKNSEIFISFSSNGM